MLFPGVVVTSDEGEWEEHRRCEASAPRTRVTPPHTIPSCMMTTLSFVRGALNPKCKDLLLCLGNHSCQLEGGKAWVGRGRVLHPVRSFIFFPCKKLQGVCSEHHYIGLLCNKKEITLWWGHSWVWSLRNSLPGNQNLLKVGLWSRILPGRDWHKRNGDS